MTLYKDNQYAKVDLVRFMYRLSCTVLYLCLPGFEASIDSIPVYLSATKSRTQKRKEKEKETGRSLMTLWIFPEHCSIDWSPLGFFQVTPCVIFSSCTKEEISLTELASRCRNQSVTDYMCI